MLATAGSWFLWDFSFYGNKVFQSTFIQILSPGASLLTTLLWTLLNSGCALVGYYVSAALVDNPKVPAACCCLALIKQNILLQELGLSADLASQNKVSKREPRAEGR